MQLSLEQRLLRFLAREERDEQRSNRELRSQPVELRVLEGECIQNAKFCGEVAGAFVFAVADNGSKFRPGDPLVVGDGIDLENGMPLQCGSYDANAGQLRLERDPFARDAAIEFAVGAAYVLDRRPLGLQGRLRDAVRAAFEAKWIANVLMGRHELKRDEGRYERALVRL
ncbi:MAG: hypothetical protein IT456_10445, partial [Planctomycetes bacterium]|nr:hypothetical protein [Planctomycetota bacterium]